MDEILIIDYGSQYTRLLARKVREVGVYSRVEMPYDAKMTENTKGIILSGGPQSVYSSQSFKLPEWVLSSNLPILGICYGMHLIVHAFGGKVERGKTFEYGLTMVELKKEPIFSKMPQKIKVWMSHGDSVTEVPEGFTNIAQSTSGIISAIYSKEKKIYGLQFHPEVSHTEYGQKMIEHFITDECTIKRDWKLPDYISLKIDEIRKTVGASKVVGAISGGVDSAVASMLTSRAIGGNLIGIFVDTGLMRNEDEAVPETLKMLGINVKKIDASKLFFERLRGVDDPEMKRKIVGETFINVFEDEAKLYDAQFLLQGTIYSDVIESASASLASSKIKSHHNVGGLPEKMNLKLLEPLRELFKDEVRNMGSLMEMPSKILDRHPFPGPGLVIRIIGDVTREKADIIKRVDEIYTNVLKESGEYEKIWQAFSVLLPVRTVGVKGDERAYGYVTALRAVKSLDGMTASWYPMPHDLLREISSKITDQVSEIGRVVYDISDKPPATIEWE